MKLLRDERLHPFRMTQRQPVAKWRSIVQHMQRVDHPCGRSKPRQVTDKMIVIPGHGAVSEKADLALFRDVLVGIRDEVATLKKQGRSLERKLWPPSLAHGRMRNGANPSCRLAHLSRWSIRASRRSSGPGYYQI